MTKTPQRELHDYISDISERADIRAGSPLPLGTLETEGGVNFAIFSRHASRVRLELFDHPEDAVPARVIDLDSARDRNSDVWHVWVEGIGPGQLYAYGVDGPYDSSEGHRFNFNRLLLDPFATAISHLPLRDFASARCYDPSALEQDLVLSKLEQGRNNNAYCQDNETSWIDWGDLEQHRVIYRFAHGMIAFCRARPALSHEQFYSGSEIQWFGPQGELPNWADPRAKQLACLIREDKQRTICLMFNASADAVDFGLPPCPTVLVGIWRSTPLAKRNTIFLPLVRQSFWTIRGHTA